MAQVVVEVAREKHQWTARGEVQFFGAFINFNGY